MSTNACENVSGKGNSRRVKSGKITSELLQKIKASINILEVVGEHVVLRKSGANYVGLCPFHSERTPSFSVSEGKQLYHCYGCKRGGDLVTFVQEILGVSFPEAVEELADRAKMALPPEWKATGSGTEPNAHRSAQRERQSVAYKLNRFAAAFFHQNLTHLRPASEYFGNRGVGPELIRGFYLGAVSEAWDDLSHYLVSKKAPLDMALELGLIRPSVKSPRAGKAVGYFDLFRGRVVFPILNLRGKIAGFGGRALGDETPKYLNSPESLIFHKSKLAFGLFQAQKHIREKDEVILVEGYFDVLALHAAGFQNVVATCGTALTSDHLNLFKRFANQLTVLFDGDKAGVAATERAMEVGLDHGWVIHGAQMPEGMDPDELVLGHSTGGKERMSKILENAQPLLDSRIEDVVQSALSEGANSEKLTQAIKKIGTWLARFQDPIGKEVRLQKLEKRLGLSKKLIQDVMTTQSAHLTRSNPQARATPEIQTRKPQTKMKATDRILLLGVVSGNPYVQILLEAKPNLPPGATLQDLWENSSAKEFIAQLLMRPGLIEKMREVPDRLWNVLEHELGNEIGDGLGLEGGLDGSVRSVITEALLSQNPPVDLEDFKGAVFRGLYQLWARFSQRVKKSIAEAEVKKDADLQMRWMKDYLDVQRKMKEFTSFYDEE